MRRAVRSELRDVPQVNVTEIRRQADDIARQTRELDQRIQVANFTTYTPDQAIACKGPGE